MLAPVAGQLLALLVAFSGEVDVSGSVEVLAVVLSHEIEVVVFVELDLTLDLVVTMVVLALADDLTVLLDLKLVNLKFMLVVLDVVAGPRLGSFDQIPAVLLYLEIIDGFIVGLPPLTFKSVALFVALSPVVNLVLLVLLHGPEGVVVIEVDLSLEDEVAGIVGAVALDFTVLGDLELFDFHLVFTILAVMSIPVLSTDKLSLGEEFEVTLRLVVVVAPVAGQIGEVLVGVTPEGNGSVVVVVVGLVLLDGLKGVVIAEVNFTLKGVLALVVFSVALDHSVLLDLELLNIEIVLVVLEGVVAVPFSESSLGIS